MSVFVDRVLITAKAGNGGNGSVSFHREKFVQNGGPDGGDGGVGGDVVLYADPQMRTLLDFRYRLKYQAGNGEDGKSEKRNGRRGEDMVIAVPVGTVVKDNSNDSVVADMYEPEMKKILLHGGKGGWGNAHFATPTRQAPNFAKPGVKTPAYELRLELKTIADVGLVGYPNVGKSTILSVVTTAKPKIANYHFTTLRPNLGVVRVSGADFVMADIPGLIEGASDGAGLGFEFLRHVERTRLLLHVVDAAGSEGRNPTEDFENICAELSRYGNLSERRQLVVANKMDLDGAEENLEKLKAAAAARGFSVYPVSAAARTGFDELMQAVLTELRSLPPVTHYEEEELLPQMTEGEGFEISLDGEVYVVEGPSMQRLIDSVNFDDEESMQWFHRTLRRWGVIDALREKGAGENSTVRVGDMEFDFVE